MLMSLQNMSAYYDGPAGKRPVTETKIWIEVFFYDNDPLKQTHLANDLKPIKYASYSIKIKTLFVNFLTAHFTLPQGTYTCSKLSNVVHLSFLLVHRLLKSCSLHCVTQ